MYSQTDYRFDKIVKSKKSTKKYTAILVHRRTGRTVQVNFGGIRSNGIPYDQFRDRIGSIARVLYHEDKDRRRRWLKRHAKDGVQTLFSKLLSKKIFVVKQPTNLKYWSTRV